MQRFRANIVVDDDILKPYVEDEWTLIQIGNDRFFVIKRCTRCTLPNNDIHTGELGKEPLQTLMSYRRVDPGSPNHACFGIMLLSEKDGIRLQLGRSLHALESGEHDTKNGYWVRKETESNVAQKEQSVYSCSVQ